MKEPCKPALICGRWDASDLLLEIRAQLRAADAGIGEVKNARLQIRLTVPPADDQANEQARKLLAKACGVGITRIQLHPDSQGEDPSQQIIQDCQSEAAPRRHSRPPPGSLRPERQLIDGGL
jgi:uncharacterized protein YggU (UPF0235/DUF167 family)